MRSSRQRGGVRLASSAQAKSSEYKQLEPGLLVPKKRTLIVQPEANVVNNPNLFQVFPALNEKYGAHA